jgi:hypothetical protein
MRYESIRGLEIALSISRKNFVDIWTLTVDSVITVRGSILSQFHLGLVMNLRFFILAPKEIHAKRSYLKSSGLLLARLH